MAIRRIDFKNHASFSRAFEALLVVSIMLSTFLAATPVSARAGERTLQDGLHMMAVSQAMLAGEVDSELEYTKVNGAMARDYVASSASVDEQLLVAMINSVKSQIAILIQECNETRRVLVEKNEECAVLTMDNICEEGKRELRNTLSLLHQIRGDKRKFFTRLAANLQRAGKSIWHAVGPVGRRILRSLGDEVVEAVKTPGGIKVRALRVLVRSRLKSLAKKEIRSAIQRGAERLIMKKWEVARGPTGDQCGGEPIVQGALDNQSSQCSYEDWFDETWADLGQRLVTDRKNCQTKAIAEYRSCLWDKAYNGVCRDEALGACQGLYDAIKLNDAGGSISAVGETHYLQAVQNEATINYPSAGGTVAAHFYYQIYDDIFGCTVTVTSDAVGEYDPEYCSMTGKATITVVHEGDVCVSSCGSAPSSPRPCPYTETGTIDWEAALEDGILLGSAGTTSCEPACFRFRSPKYGVTP